jgi:NADH-quinone oxidoreductase subunit L
MNHLLPILLVLAWLLPLASFASIVLFGPRMGRHGRGAGYVATGAIAASFLLALVALIAWISHNPISLAGHGSHGGEHASAAVESTVEPIVGELYTLGEFGNLRITIGYYIDALTVAMFAMVTLVATCIHVYSSGYMHEELHDVTDPLAPLANGQPLKRRGRYHRFYQYLSLFCFSMLGLVLAGNVAMVFVFWELVGICSYFLIGFYFERKSASNAANKAFIVNRVGDFGMIIGLMALWSSLGTFSFAEIFPQVRPHGEPAMARPYVPDGMVRWSARHEADVVYRQTLARTGSPDAAELAVRAQIPTWREKGFGYGLLVVAGLGIFCGCVGKSAQFPLHVWLPDAMEGPTPVSALIHAATMVAAGVYLVGRFYPVFAPEVLIAIAVVGCLTLFIAATIALVQTDIKRVLAYSTVSQLGYMMFALGVGGWLAGLFHLFTHAFFKALLFLGSGSVIHATGTNEMTKMGGLVKKLPWTAFTMLAGCLAIAGAGIPFVIGLSGYYSKDAILAQAYSFHGSNVLIGGLFYVALGGAGLTSFYMFRLWYMTFVGKPRDKHIYEHAHESPPSMYVPLVILAFFSVVMAWPIFGFTGLLEQARPAGTDAGASGGLFWAALSLPAEAASHASQIHLPVTLMAFGTALTGFLLATAFYGVQSVDPADVRRAFPGLYRFLWNKWWFDEAYRFLFIRPALTISNWIAAADRSGIDRAVDGLARAARGVSIADDWFDRTFVDGLVNRTADWVYAVGLWMRTLQTGRLRQYVLFVAVGTVALFVIASLYWNYLFASLAPPLMH